MGLRANSHTHAGDRILQVRRPVLARIIADWSSSDRAGYRISVAGWPLEGGVPIPSRRAISSLIHCCCFIMSSGSS